MDYIEKAGKPSGECIFCAKPCEDCDRANCIVHRGQTCFVILNVFPYNNGHLMVIPYQHTSELAELTPEVQAEMMRLATLSIAALKRLMCPDGFNIGMNLGRAGGAGIAEHLHLHIVPRWVGDTNFITTVGHTRVLPEALDRTWEKMRDAFQIVLAEASS
jgi:ATP adenylyltransferase